MPCCSSIATSLFFSDYQIFSYMAKCGSSSQRFLYLVFCITTEHAFGKRTHYEYSLQDDEPVENNFCDQTNLLSHTKSTIYRQADALSEEWCTRFYSCLYKHVSIAAMSQWFCIQYKTKYICACRNCAYMSPYLQATGKSMTKKLTFVGLSVIQQQRPGANI